MLVLRLRLVEICVLTASGMAAVMNEPGPRPLRIGPAGILGRKWFKKENFCSLTPHLPPRGPGPMSAAYTSSLPLVTITLLVSFLDEELEKQRDLRDF